MTLEYLLLFIAMFLLLLDIYSLSKIKSLKKSYSNNSSFYLFSIFAILTSISFISYLHSFLTDNFILKDVYAYCSTYLAVEFKIYASWASLGGSLLLWTMILTLIILIYRFSNPFIIDRFKIRSYILLNISLVFLSLATILSNPFSSYSFKPIDGLGLNPLLQSPWMGIHPPIIFLGYSLTIFCLALSLARIDLANNLAVNIVNYSAKLAWLFLSIGIALGGIWAYEELGWGGYWSWDPVETASLLPWLALTAYFHSSFLSNSKKTIIKELIILIAALLVIFSTLITRSGLLESIHAFGASTTTYPFIAMAAFFIFVFSYFKIKTGKIIFSIKKKSTDAMSIFGILSVASIFYIVAVCLIGLLIPLFHSVAFGEAIIIDKYYYNTMCLPPTIIFVIAIMCCNIAGKTNFRKYVVVILSTMIIGILTAILRIPTDNPVANFGISTLLIALITIAYSYSFDYIKKRRLILFNWGRRAIHIAIIIILLGVLLSSTLETNDRIIVGTDSKTSVLGTELRISDYRFEGPTGRIYARGNILPDHSSLYVNIITSIDNTSFSNDLYAGLYTVHGFVLKPYISRTLTKDVYIALDYSDSIYQGLLLSLTGNVPGEILEFPISIKIVPYVNLLWFGITLLSAGIVASIINDIYLIKKTRHTRK
ncbi:MAG: cytochrome c biogenesis protein CcsA [Candidatus Bathyarchaeota archaeon]|nr:cytochrome c biogenesis protein CcsA [Candidatus Bathyarchaeota archaeon]